ncbi:MAG: hypothetical protein HZA79_13330 [Sphingobacteriales bacterium]|nr:hypothetical protein [Sphingobacteriales bacterium]
MRENEFEKGIAEKMGEFRLQPSAPVWPEVERRIREQKRRRIIFFWFTLGSLLLFGIAGWWWMGNSGHPLTRSIGKNESPVRATVIPAHTGDRQPEINLERKKGETKVAPAAGDDNGNRQDVFPVTGHKDEKKRVTAAAKSKNKIDRFKRISAPVIPVAVNNSESGEKKKFPAQNNNTPASPLLPAKTGEPLTADAPSPAVPAGEPLAGKKDIKPVTTAVNNGEPVPAVDTVSQALAQNEAEPPVKKKKKEAKHKWETGFSFAIGESKLTNGNLAVFGEKRLDSYQSGMNNPNPGSTPFVSFADSIPLKGPALHIGGYAKRKLGRRTAFSAGLNLAFYSGKQRVGVFVDSTKTLAGPYFSVIRDGYYRTGSQSRYNNRYYYLQLPLLFHWQLNQGRHMPVLEWENGLLPSVLTGSRALVYDRPERLFFRDKTVYNTFSLAYQTGISALLFPGKKHPLSAGLYYNYHFSKLQKQNPPEFNHLGSYGLQLRWMIKK